MKSLLGRLRYQPSRFYLHHSRHSFSRDPHRLVRHSRSAWPGIARSTPPTPLRSRFRSPRDLSTDFTRIAKQVGPAVVNINTITLPKQRDQSRGRNPHSRQFQQQQPPERLTAMMTIRTIRARAISRTSSTASSAVRAESRMRAARSANRSAPALSSILAATSSLTITSSTRPTGSSSASPPIPTAATFRAARQKS